jgi:beta-glucosidase
LAAFAKVNLEPGDTEPVTIAVDPERLAYYHDGFDQWVIEPGDYEFLVGGSAADIRHTARFTLTAGTMPREVYTLDHTLGDLFKDERGRVVVDFLTTQMGFGSLGDAGPENFMAVAIGQMQFLQVAIFGAAMGVTEEALNGLLGLINSDMEPSAILAILEQAAQSQEQRQGDR